MLWPIDPLGGLTLILETLGRVLLALVIVGVVIAIVAEMIRRR